MSDGEARVSNMQALPGETIPGTGGDRSARGAEIADGHPANGAWEALMTAHAALNRRFNAEDVWEDFSMKEYDVLYTLSKCENPIRLSELNRHVLLSQPALSRMVDRLADRGLISRVADPRDGRGVGLSLTADGRAVQRRIGRRHGRSVAQAMLSGLTPAELRSLEDLCAKLAAAATRSGKDLK
jgi:DNA-binding MarR family transcriptional regulator